MLFRLKFFVRRLSSKFLWRWNCSLIMTVQRFFGEVKSLSVFKFIEAELTGFGKFNGISHYLSLDSIDEFFEDDRWMIELFLPWKFLIECWIGLVLGFEVVFLDLVNFFDNTWEFALINVGFGAVESDFFLELKEFGLKLVFFVFLFFEFGLKFLGQKLEGLVLLLKQNGLAVNVFHKNLFFI